MQSATAHDESEDVDMGKAPMLILDSNIASESDGLL
jgi:hypothetical protein